MPDAQASTMSRTTTSKAGFPHLHGFVRVPYNELLSVLGHLLHLLLHLKLSFLVLLGKALFDYGGLYRVVSTALARVLPSSGCRAERGRTRSTFALNWAWGRAQVSRHMGHLGV